MAEEIVLLGTSILIDFFRKKNKQNTAFYKAHKSVEHFAISSITKYEILIGSNSSQRNFWDSFFGKMQSLAFDDEVNDVAVKIFQSLKAQNKLIEYSDSCNCNLSFHPFIHIKQQAL